MPANTPIVGLPYPLGSDPVRDGDNDIRALADAVEQKAGLWRIIPTVSGSGFSVNSVGRVTITSAGTSGGFILNCFSSSFRNYRMILTGGIGSTTGYIAFRLSQLTSPNSTASSYTRTQVRIFAGAVTASDEQNTFFLVGNTTTTASMSSSIDFLQPQLATGTNFITTLTNADNASQTGGGRHSVATAYDSLQLFCNTGTFSATVDIYGYN